MCTQYRQVRHRVYDAWALFRSLYDLTRGIASTQAPQCNILVVIHTPFELPNDRIHRHIALVLMALHIQTSSVVLLVVLWVSSNCEYAADILREQAQHTLHMNL